MTKEQIKVIATDSENNSIEKWVVYNGQYGIVCEKGKAQEGELQVHVVVGSTYVGSHEEWDKHIESCIVSTLTEMDLTYMNSYGELSVITE